MFAVQNLSQENVSYKLPLEQERSNSMFVNFHASQTFFSTGTIDKKLNSLYTIEGAEQWLLFEPPISLELPTFTSPPTVV